MKKVTTILIALLMVASLLLQGCATIESNQFKGLDQQEAAQNTQETVKTTETEEVQVKTPNYYLKGRYICFYDSEESNRTNWDKEKYMQNIEQSLFFHFQSIDTSALSKEELEYLKTYEEEAAYYFGCAIREPLILLGIIDEDAPRLDWQTVKDYYDQGATFDEMMIELLEQGYIPDFDGGSGLHFFIYKISETETILLYTIGIAALYEDTSRTDENGDVYHEGLHFYTPADSR